MDLPRPLLPGDSMTVSFTFDGKVRKRVDRSGYTGNHYDMAQWYPKVVVYDQNGFHADQFMTGEFYGEFGTFDVHIEVPDNYVVVATGMVQSGDPGWDYNPAHQPDAPVRKATGNKTVHFHAEKVHDFAWCADPTYVVQQTTLDGIDIRSAYRRKSAKTWEDSTLAHAVRAVTWLGKKVGKYPYPQVTVAEMTRGGGMEYPMLVMDGRDHHAGEASEDKYEEEAQDEKHGRGEGHAAVRHRRDPGEDLDAARKGDGHARGGKEAE
jgi:hypothetical protein